MFNRLNLLQSPPLGLADKYAEQVERPDGRCWLSNGDIPLDVKVDMVEVIVFPKVKYFGLWNVYALRPMQSLRTRLASTYRGLLVNVEHRSWSYFRISIYERPPTGKQLAVPRRGPGSGMTLVWRGGIERPFLSLINGSRCHCLQYSPGVYRTKPCDACTSPCTRQRLIRFAVAQGGTSLNW